MKRSRVRQAKIVQALEKAEIWQWGQHSELCRISAKESNGFDALLGESVVDVYREVVSHDGWRKTESRSPFAHKVFDVGKSMIARADEIAGDCGCGDVTLRERLRPDSPHGRNPGQTRPGGPLVRDVKPLAGSHSGFNAGALFDGQQSGIADQQGGVGLLEHGDGIGGMSDEAGVSAEGLAEEDLNVSPGATGGVVGGYGPNGLKCVRLADDQLNGTDAIERGDGAAGYDGELGSEGGDGDQAEVGSPGEQLVGAEGWQGVVELIPFGEFRGEWRVLQVPHQRSRIEKADGGDANGME